MIHPPPSWQETNRVQPLSRGEVHVWHIRLSAPAPADAVLLSEDEMERAQRYHFARDRDRYVACRAKLRQFLGQYLNESPQRLVFQYGSHGKPMLAPPTTGHALCFNVSHSGDAALLAFALGRQVGVDIESLETSVDFHALADRFMSPLEAAYVRGAADIARAFYTCWTRKEAWMKAVGTGLTDSMERFDVSPSLGKITTTLAWRDVSTSNWTLHELIPIPHLVGALAVEGSSANVTCWREK